MTQATLLGLAIGDALGQPFEFSTAKQILASGWKGDLIGGARGYEGMWKLQPGQWTDDTKMALALAESLIESDGFDLDHLAQKYIEWVESGDLRGIGVRTESSIHNLMRGISPQESGKKHAGRKKPSFKQISKAPEEDSESLHGRGDFCGCGTVMRCAPIGVFFREDPEQMSAAAWQDATMTHDHPDARDASLFLCLMIEGCLSGKTKEEVLDHALHPPYYGGNCYSYDHVSRLIERAQELIQESKRPTFAEGIVLGPAGTAHETLASAVYCFLISDNFREAVTRSVLIGGDTDSRAAIAGALAGAFLVWRASQKSGFSRLKLRISYKK